MSVETVAADLRAKALAAEVSMRLIPRLPHHGHGQHAAIQQANEAVERFFQSSLAVMEPLRRPDLCEHAKIYWRAVIGVVACDLLDEAELTLPITQRLDLLTMRLPRRHPKTFLYLFPLLLMMYPPFNLLLHKSAHWTTNSATRLITLAREL